MNSVLFHAEVADDLNEATRWYEQRKKGLGRGFRSAFAEALERVAATPLRFSQVRGRVRCARIRGFPYGIFYEIVREGVVVVYAVLHERRDPKGWQRRL